MEIFEINSMRTNKGRSMRTNKGRNDMNDDWRRRKEQVTTVFIYMVL
jgi:hypothetical protein